jgi:hypothetical protein
MAYREVSVIEVKEMLRLWLEGRSLREVTTEWTVRRSVAMYWLPRPQAWFGGVVQAS